MIGTPKTLKEACGNGLKAAALEGTRAVLLVEGSRRIIAEHVRDFLAQRFSAAMLESETLAEQETLNKLFEEITK